MCITAPCTYRGVTVIMLLSSDLRHDSSTLTAYCQFNEIELLTKLHHVPSNTTYNHGNEV